jgi:DNA invertase Pin-like site-specific DNA recombinase
MKSIARKPKQIVYWAFSVEIVGPRYRAKVARRKIRKILSQKFLRVIEKTIRQTAEKKLPQDFRIRIS